MDDKITTSPIPEKGVVIERQILTFAQAIDELTKGSRITREEWNDEYEYGLLKDGWLCIFTRGEFHTWTVSESDILAADWYVLETN